MDYYCPAGWENWDGRHFSMHNVGQHEIKVLRWQVVWTSKSGLRQLAELLFDVAYFLCGFSKYVKIWNGETVTMVNGHGRILPDYRISRRPIS